MATFTVRVELRNKPTGEDYETLHKAMAAEGFGRTITDDKGIQYQLPMAEYSTTSSLDKRGVLHKAKSAAAKTGKKASLLVTVSQGRTWDNLDTVKRT